MVAIPQNPVTTVSEIYASYEASSDDGFRMHLGASLIGRPCRRQLWYVFHWVKKAQHSGRVLRLFQRGHKEEGVFVSELKAIGCKVMEKDPKTGQQWQYADVGGHMGGSMDGAGLGLIEAPKTWHVLEFKTHGAKSFNDLKKNGVEKSKPEHFAQMQVYMHWSKMARAYYLSVNKDSDELYGERIHYDKEFAERMIERARKVVESPEPLERVKDDPSWYQCKWCDYHGICHGNDGVEVNCRTCAHSTPETDAEARWSCAYWKTDIPGYAQRAGCPHHVLNPSLVNWATQVDANPEENWVEYETPNGTRFKNGGDGYASREVSALDAETIESVEQDELIQSLRKGFQGEVTDYVKADA